MTLNENIFRDEKGVEIIKNFNLRKQRCSKYFMFLQKEKMQIRLTQLE